MNAAIINLTPDQLHDIVGGMFKRGKDVPLELATSTMFHMAEELRLVSTTAAHSGGDNEPDIGNVLFTIAERLEAMATLCDELGKKATEAKSAKPEAVPS